MNKSGFRIPNVSSTAEGGAPMVTHPAEIFLTLAASRLRGRAATSFLVVATHSTDDGHRAILDAARQERQGDPIEPVRLYPHCSCAPCNM
jgi:hypothetical protein